MTFAHRGARLEARENSIAAFQLALAAGVGGLESDVRLSGDRQPVLAHDPAVRRGLRRVRVAETSAPDLAALEVPTLESLYAECGTDFELSLDLKDAEVASATIALARDAHAADRLWLCSPDLNLLEQLRRTDPDIRLVHSTRKRELVSPIERHGADLARLGIHAMNMHHTDWTAGLVSLFHRFAVAAFAWDVQEVRSIRTMLRIGVDAIYCDRPERMMATIEEFAGEPS
jgi:glycerophosphoryl diester phosphodiesterase